MRFEELDINDKIKKALKLDGYENMTKVQEEAIPHILRGVDAIVKSKTGSGKTAAFSVPVLDSIDTSKNSIQALILCPTRELALQVYEVIKRQAMFMSEVKILCIYGGQSIEKQIIPLRRGVHIVVSTPGRIIDHIRRKTIKLDYVSKFILDEADEMLKMGFEEDIDKIASATPIPKQTLLFSATFSEKVKSVAAKYLNSPKIIDISSDGLITCNVKQYAVDIKTKMKYEAIKRLVEYYKPNKCSVFCNTKNEVDEVCSMLSKEGYLAMPIHSDIRQEQRTIIMNRFKEGKFNILVATDVAARGLDIPNLDLVINYDIPKEYELYVHRIGRTGRNGKSGISITFVVGKEKNKIEILEKYTGSKLEYITLPTSTQLKDMKNQEILNRIRTIIENGDYSNLSLYDKICTDNGHNYKEISKALYTLLFGKTETIGVEDDSSIVKLFFNCGKDDMIKAKDIVGAIANNTALIGKEIGKIEVKDKFSFVEVKAKYVDEVIFKLNGMKIKNKRVEVEVANNNY